MQVESKVEGRDREEKDGKTLRTVLEITLSFMKKIQFDHVSSIPLDGKMRFRMKCRDCLP